MVYIHCKRLPVEENSKSYDEFMYQCLNETNIGEASDTVRNIQNIRVRIKWMCDGAKGVAKELDIGRDDVSTLLLQVAAEGERYLDLARIQSRPYMFSDEKELTKLCEDIRGAVIMAHPEKCSGSDAQSKLVQAMDGEDTSEKERALAHHILACLDDEATTQDTLLAQEPIMWWSGKPLTRSETFTKYIGKNEKTKLVVKLGSDAEKAPPREAPIDQKTQSDMMAYWYRKQEQHKKLVEDEDISYANSNWANTQQLKNQLQGTDGVKFKPF